MKTASQELIHEHEAILVALAIVEKMSKLFQSEKDVETIDIKKILEFIKVFADKCHHGKEEGLLFPALEEAGFSSQMGPVGVMLYEHDLGRGLIGKMSESVSGSTVDKKTFFQAALQYAHLMRGHIDKENNILFPMGDAALSESKQQELLAKFQLHEETVVGAGKHEEFHALLNEFKVKYL